MISKRELVVLMNGSMIGTTVSAVDNLILLARDFNQEYIKLFISTWDYPENDKWLDAILNRVQRLNLDREVIKVTVIKEEYNSPSAYAYFNEFQTRLGLQSHIINPQVSKRLFYFYTLVRGLQKIEEYSNTCTILRLVSNVDVLVSYIPFTFDSKLPNLKNILIDSYYNRIPKIAPPKFQGLDFCDILFSPTISPYYIEEKIWVSSIEIAKKIYSTNLQESIDRLVNYYLNLKREKGITVDFTTSEQISTFFSDRFVTPIDTGITINYLANTYAPSCLLFQISDILGEYNILHGLRNPYLEISSDNVKEISPLELPRHPRHILELPKNSKLHI